MSFRRPGLAVGVAAAAVCAAGSVLWVSISSASRPSAAISRSSAAVHRHKTSAPQVGTTAPAGLAQDAGPSAGAALGAYVGPGALAAADALDERLDGKIGSVLDFLPRSSWTSMVDISWTVQRWAGSGFDLVLGVPLLPNAGASLAAGAAGAYDSWFGLLANRLVQSGLGRAVLMLGWQPDDKGRPWYVGSAPRAAEYVTYWRRVQRVMSAVAGSDFVFEWDAGDSGSSPLSPAAMYPGNTYVDIVATDAFDTAPPSTPAASQWTSVLYERYGPAWMWSFAVAHGKPMAIAMWGEVPLAFGGSGDDADYVRQFLRWTTTSHIEMSVLWDYGAWSITRAFPVSAAALTDEVAHAQPASARLPAPGKPGGGG